ncbi:TonB-dependent receptor family protein [Parvicella tangerina]|uniref:Vitamin B12 transporter BtuB n=1 Tax=Parvicella tangerina TaxID=2829795 RepID=A0A916NS28_9FLAO|nr:TonB-dependent receptor family protein [Parvicella tangerina]CAG5082859.1 Vitamin B12 transporter BtuB [Parvicella tangerina]
MKTFHSVIVVLVMFLYAGSFNAQYTEVTLSGTLIDETTKDPMPFVNVVIKNANDSSFVNGTISDENGIFTLKNIKPSNYLISISFVGYKNLYKEVYVGSSADYLNLGTIQMEENTESLDEVQVTAKEAQIGAKMDKKTYAVEDNLSQTGGSALQAMENLPGITVQDNKVQLRGSDKIIILIDGKQSALTGFGSQSGLDNIPASSIEKIEIINNPSSKFDANGNAGIINIILKKEKKEGFNGKVGFAVGSGANWIKRANIPDVHDQYQNTPKLNPSISLNYRKKKINAFLQVDNLYTHTLNKNEFVTREYTDSTVVNQQTVRNRNTNFFTSKMGLDWFINDKNQLTVSGMFGSEKILDHGDEAFFNGDYSERLRLWQFLEDELKTTVNGNLNFEHKFKEPGRQLNASLNYTFHRENEQYFFTNTIPNYVGDEHFKLLSDENVGNLNLDYIHPLKYGKLESGVKLRARIIPTNMQFFPSAISPFDSTAGGKATYNELIPALYSNYSFDSKKWEGEVGLRVEYVNVYYEVNPNHPTYHSDGYDYFQPFPNLRLGYKLNDKNKLVAFFNRRVDRPNEVDIRVFPKYDDAEIIKVGNPSLGPQFTNNAELSYKHSFEKGFWYTSVYSRFSTGTITRISTTVDSSNLIYAIFQNAGKSNVSGVESVFSQNISDFITYNLGVNVYYNQIDAFTVDNLYPTPHTFTADKQEIISGNVKLNTSLHFKKDLDVQLTAIYLAPDIIPQGQIAQRFTLNLGVKKSIQKGKGQLFFNASDLLNTMVIKKTITGNNFTYVSSNYYETQVFRIGYNYKF